MSDRNLPAHFGSKEAIIHVQEARYTPPTEPSKPSRPEDTSLGKSVLSSPYKSPLSALRTGEKWTSHTLADVLGLSPGIRGPSLLLSPLCSRAAATSPGPGSGSGSIAHKQASRQPLMPLEDCMKVAANMHSSQPLPEKPAWGEQSPRQASKAAVRRDGRKTPSAGQDGQRPQGVEAALSEQNKQDASSPLVDKQGSADTGTGAKPSSQQSQDGHQDRLIQNKDSDVAEMTLSEPQRSALPSLPGKQLSFHLTPTLEVDLKEIPPGSAQPKATDHAAETSPDGHSHGTSSAQHVQALTGSVQAAQPEPAVLSDVSEEGACDAAEQPQTEDIMLLPAQHHAGSERLAVVSPGAAASPCLVPNNLPDTEVQHCPKQLLTPCPAGKSTLVEPQVLTPGMALPPAPAAPAEGPHSQEKQESLLELQPARTCKQLACETQLELEAPASLRPAHQRNTDPKQGGLQPQNCTACPQVLQEAAQGGSAAAECTGPGQCTIAATSVQDNCRQTVPAPGDALTVAAAAAAAAAAAQGATYQKTAHPSQAPRGPVSLARIAGMGSPAPSEQVTDMAWPDSEEIERGVKEAGGDCWEALGLKLIHKFNYAILMGDPAGGVFIAVDKDDMHAMTKALGVSNDDQTIEAWRRRLLSKRYEHGLLEWEMEDAAEGADLADQLLESPMPGISALVCTTAEVTARQHLLASSGAVNSMPELEGCAQTATAEDKAEAAPLPDFEGGRPYAGCADRTLCLRNQSAWPQGQEILAETGAGAAKEAHSQGTEEEPDTRHAQHGPEARVESGGAAGHIGSISKANAPKQLAVPSSGCSMADKRRVQGNAQQIEEQSAQVDGINGGSSKQQPDQQDRTESTLPAQNSAPALKVDQLCPSLNLKFFTQAGVLGVFASEKALQDGLREKLTGAEAAGQAAPLLHLTETAVEEGGPMAISPMPQAGPAQHLALCLQFDATQLEAALGAAGQAEATADEPCTAVIPDTMEPCSNSKDTPKSKHQTDQGRHTADPGHPDAQPASPAQQEEKVRKMTGVPAPPAEGDRHKSSLHNPAKKAMRKRQKQERAAATLRASSSRRRSQAFMLNVPAVRRMAAAAGRPAWAIESDPSVAAADQPLLARPGSASPAGRPGTNGRGGAAAAADPVQPDRHKLGPVKGAKRLCKRWDADRAAAMADVASMPASLADSTQQESAPYPPESPLRDRLAGDAAPSAVPEADSPLPDWLCGDAPGKAPGRSAMASVSPLWLMDSEEARTVQLCKPTLAPHKGERLPNLSLGRATDLADPPSSLVGDTGEHGRQQAQGAAEGGQGDRRAGAAFGAWRSRGGFAQPPQLPFSAVERRRCCTSRHTYHDTFSFPDSQHLSKEQLPATALLSDNPKSRAGPVQSGIQHKEPCVASRKGQRQQTTPTTAQHAFKHEGYRTRALRRRGSRRAPHTMKGQAMRCHGRPQRSKKVPRKFSDFTQGQGLDAPREDKANLPSPSRSPAKWSIMKAADMEAKPEEEPKQALPAPAAASPASMEQAADVVSKGCAPEEVEQDAAAAAGAGGGRAVKLGCSKCRMSSKGCSVCRVKAGLAPLPKTHPSPRKPAQRRKAPPAEDAARPALDLPGRPPAAAWPGAAAASPRVPGRHARKRSLASLQLKAEAAVTIRNPGNPAAPRVVPHPAPAPGGACPSPCRHTAQQPQDRDESVEALADGQAWAADRPEEDVHELIEDSQSLGGACEASPVSPGVNSTRPLKGPGAEQECESPPAGQRSASKGPHQHPSSRAAATAPAQGGQAPAAPHVPSLSWHGALRDPPAGLGLPATSTRQYYNGFTKDGKVVNLGDAVELCMLPGDQAPRVALLQALWSQAAMDGCERMFAQCCLFYRPSETVFHGTNAPNELFASTHIEERLPLQRVSASCTVDTASGGKRGMLADTADYVCTYLYDHRNDMLSRLPGV